MTHNLFQKKNLFGFGRFSKKVCSLLFYNRDFPTFLKSGQGPVELGEKSV